MSAPTIEGALERMARMRANDPAAIFSRGGRTGRKIHTTHRNSSVLGCGHWTKALNVHFRLDDAAVAVRPNGDLCERCFA